MNGSRFDMRGENRGSGGIDCWGLIVQGKEESWCGIDSWGGSK